MGKVELRICAMKMTGLTLEKWIWSEEDFSEMNWSGSRVHALGTALRRAESGVIRDLLFDIDYVFHAGMPLVPARRAYWVAPATLVFEHASEVELYLRSYEGDFTLGGIGRCRSISVSNGDRESGWLWLVSGQGYHSNARFHALGYKQYFRRPPVLKPWPALGLDAQERGGMTFSCVVPEGTK